MRHPLNKNCSPRGEQISNGDNIAYLISKVKLLTRASIKDKVMSGFRNEHSNSSS